MAETEQFQVGDVVRLKSGGPAMTVVSEVLAQPKGKHRCVCFAGDNLHEVLLPPEALERAKPGGSGDLRLR